jgi:DNA-directed RNA polymerase specialized sigma24 family protein
VREHERSRRVRTAARRELGLPVDAYVDDELDAARLAGELRAALEELSPAQRRAVELRVLGGHDYTTIACAVDATSQGARLRVSRGLRSLRGRLAQDVEAP